METQQVQTDSTQTVMALVAEKLLAAKKAKGKKAERLREEADRLLEKILMPPDSGLPGSHHRLGRSGRPTSDPSGSE